MNAPRTTDDAIAAVREMAAAAGMSPGEIAAAFASAVSDYLACDQAAAAAETPSIAQSIRAAGSPGDRLRALLTLLPARPCRLCGRPVFWLTTKNGKAAPISAYGITHFADCPRAEEFRAKGKKRNEEKTQTRATGAKPDES